VSLIIHKGLDVESAMMESGLNERIDNRCKAI
jgi:hypothetical protein